MMKSIFCFLLLSSIIFLGGCSYNDDPQLNYGKVKILSMGGYRSPAIGHHNQSDKRVLLIINDKLAVPGDIWRVGYRGGNYYYLIEQLSDKDSFYEK